jgi:hypothetical protein
MGRWIVQDGSRQCTDSGDFAQEPVFGFSGPAAQLSHALTAHHANEPVRNGHKMAVAPMRGQTIPDRATPVRFRNPDPKLSVESHLQ